MTPRIRGGLDSGSSTRVARALAIALLAAAIAPAQPGAAASGEAPAASAPAAPAAPAARAGDGAAHVTYVTSSTVYIDAGRDRGLSEGTIVEVVRADTVVAVLRVTSLSSKGAACERIEPGAAIGPGDSVRFVPAVEEPIDPALEPTVARPPAPPQARLRGRIGVRMLALREDGGPRNGFYQPSVDARLNGPISASWLLEADVRTRQTYRSQSGDASQNRTRVHRMSLAWQRPGSSFRVVGGRLLSPSLATISVFDGALAEHRGTNWSAGLFSGTQPDAVTYGFDAGIREHGGFVERRGGVGGAARYAVTLGAIGSYEEGRINREFLYLQARSIGPRHSIYWSQEVDANRSWKADAGERLLTPTSTFVSARYQLAEPLTMTGSYDNRRNVRLYRDRITPETEFDDAYRQGVSAGAEARVSRYRVSASTRLSSGAESHTLSMEARGVSSLALTLGARSTRFRSDRVEGWLHSGRVGIPLAPGIESELEGGVRDERALSAGYEGSRLGWIGVDLTAALGRRWFAIVTTERNFGADVSQTQVYTSLSYRL